MGVILAAGAGSRYGRPKILVDGWLDAAASALLGGGCDDVVVVVGAAPATMPEGARAVANEHWSSGMATSVRTGLLECAATTARTAVLHVVDTPDVGADVVERVLVGAGHTGLARAAFGGDPGHPVVLARRWWDPVLRTVAGDRGARDFLGGHPDLVLVECGDLATGRDHDRRRPGYGPSERGTPNHADEFDRG